MLIDADHDGYEYEALVGHYATLIFLINSGGISKTLCENIIKHSKDDNNCYKELIEKILEIEDSLKNISQNITPLRKPSEVFLYDK